MKIITHSDIPDQNYYVSDHVAPISDGQGIHIWQGKGEHRSWGQPSINSHVVFRGKSLIAILVGWYTKHSRGQQWYYFRKSEVGVWQKVKWSHLSDSDRKKVLKKWEIPVFLTEDIPFEAQKAAYSRYSGHSEDDISAEMVQNWAQNVPHQRMYRSRLNPKRTLPGWAKCPGKLKSDRKKLQKPTIRHKIVARDADGRLFSVFNPDIEYVLGQKMTEKAIANHRGGYYAYDPDQDIKLSFEAQTLFPEECVRWWRENGADFVLLEVEQAGKQIAYRTGKVASTHLTPVRILEEL